MGRKRKTDEQFRREVYDLVGGEYEFLEEYKTNKLKIAVRHEGCGSEYEVSPNNFLRGRRCSKCSFRNKAAKETKTDEQFTKEVYELVGDKYTFMETYQTIRTKISVRHEECGYEYEVTPDKFLNGRRCPNCFESKGEYAVKTALDSLGVEYIREYRFNYLGRQRYDFYLPSLYACIEYDGEQHFKAVEHWGGEEALARTQESDRIKNEFAHSINLRMLRIPYTELEDVGALVSRWIAEIKTQEYTDSTPIETVEAV